MDQLAERFTAKAMFSKPPQLEFRSEASLCSQCGGALTVLKTRKKTIYTLTIGEIQAKEVILKCRNDGTVYCSEALKALVPRRCQYGFDVMVWVGRALFLQGKSEKTILVEMRQRNVHISPNEIGYLGKKFVAYLAIAHQQREADLKKFMAKSGGYILHFDGTCDGDSPQLVTGLDGVSDIVLGSIKVRSEKAELLAPFFENIKQRYGAPVALVHDMGAGFLAASEQVFPGVPDFICHYHFLRDIGKDLFEKEYRLMKSRLAKLRVRNLLQVKARLLTETKKLGNFASIEADLKISLESGVIKTEHLKEFPSVIAFVLIRWALDTRFDLDGYGFPFDQHHYAFYCRLKTVHAVAGRIMNIHISGKWSDNNPLSRIKLFLDEIIGDPLLVRTSKILAERIDVFNKLRTAMRIAQPDGQNGLNDDGDPDIGTIKKRVTAFRQTIAESTHLKDRVYAKMVKQLEKYWIKLFADPIVVKGEHETHTIQPQRTNNVLERFFRDLRRTCRKRTGMKSINKALKAMLAETPLVKNLANPPYVKILLGDAATLEQLFAQIDASLVKKKIEAARTDREKLTPTLRKIVFRENLPNEIAGLFQKWVA